MRRRTVPAQVRGRGAATEGGRDHRVRSPYKPRYAHESDGRDEVRDRDQWQQGEAPPHGNQCHHQSWPSHGGDPASSEHAGKATHGQR